MIPSKMKSSFGNIQIPNLLAMLGGVISAMLGISVLTGWYTQNETLIQVSTAFVPMQFNTALGFLLSGLGLLFVIRWHRGAGTVLGFLVMLIGLLTLAEYILGIDFGIDQLFMQHYITTETSHPGRMAPNTALCFSLTGTALAVLGRSANSWKSNMTSGILGSLIFALSIVALAGYAIHFEAAYGWGNLTRMAVHTASGFVILGMVITSLAWQGSVSASSNSPSWLAMPVGIVVVTIMSYSLISGSSMVERHTPMLDAAMEITLQAALAHLWFEEIISGDRHEDISIVWNNLDQSAWYARAMLEGGKNAEGTFVPLASVALRTEIEEVLAKINAFRTIAEKRWATKNQSGIGSDIDQRFDALFNDFMAQAGAVETALQGSMAQELRRFRIIQGLLIALVLGLSAVVSVILMRYDRRQRLATEDIRRLNEGLEGEVSARTWELEIANERLQELDRLKSMFIASMSHELRTPLNSIIGFSSMIVQDMTGPISDQQRDYLQRVQRAGEHLLALITDVIDISKIEAGKLAVQYSHFALDEITSEALEGVETETRQKGLELTASIPTDIEMYTDRKRLLQCLLNFLSNAVKYSERGSIRLEARPFDEQVELSVSDTGIGIPEQEVGQLFEPFVRLESQLKMHTTGTGLGLYLTRKLARDVLGGEVSVTSRAGEGSTFSLRIPQRMPPDEDDTARGSNDDK